MRSSRFIALAAVTGALMTTTALAHPPLTPAPKRSAHFTPNPAKPPFIAPPKSKSGTWQALANTFPGSGFPDTAMLLTDGTVMMHDGCTTNWFKLTPDNTGGYHNGTWSKMGAMPTGYNPLYFGSQVMPDGKHVTVEGGEYINCKAVWTNLGAIYNRSTDSWTAVPPPTGWTKIGDAQSVVRTDGNVMQADCCTEGAAIGSISGETVTWTSTGTGKADAYDEEGWTQLPDGTIFSVDANRDLGGPNDVEIYSEATGAWTTNANKTPAACTDAASHEIGPGALLPNGLVYQICGTPHTAVYAPLTGTWTAGPDVPAIDGALDVADGPAAVLPDGNVLFQASPGVFLGGPSHFFEAAVKVKNGTPKVKITQVSEPADAPNINSYEGRMLVLPTGEVFWSDDNGDIEIYTPQGKVAKQAVPTIKHVAATLTHGSANNSISGKGFNGVTYGGYYGDDVQESSNYPILRITNTGSSHVCFGNSHNYATGISDGSMTNAQFDIPASCETGASTLQVVVNGVASKAKNVTIN